MWETRVPSLGREDLLEEEMAAHSSTLAWKIPWTEESGRLQSMGWQRVRRDWATSLPHSLGPSAAVLSIYVCLPWNSLPSLSQTEMWLQHLCPSLSSKIQFLHPPPGRSSVTQLTHCPIVTDLLLLLPKWILSSVREGLDLFQFCVLSTSLLR